MGLLKKLGFWPLLNTMAILVKTCLPLALPNTCSYKKIGENFLNFVIVLMISKSFKYMSDPECRVFEFPDLCRNLLPFAVLFA